VKKCSDFPENAVFAVSLPLSRKDKGNIAFAPLSVNPVCGDGEPSVK
jgi:hypothetical protein